MDEKVYEAFLNSTGVCIDTRKIYDGCFFVCIQGENFNGNTFATDAINQGASHVIVDNKEFYDEEKPMTLVNDSVLFLQQLANHHRRQFNIPIIGITGSNGKTTTKELIRTVLDTKYEVLATKGNLNNHIGVPLTLLELKSSHQIAIIEMGANRFKDIEELCVIAEPDYGIITNIGAAHLEGFKSIEGVIKTKRELYDTVSQVSGTIIINLDDSLLTRIVPNNVRLVTYGMHDGSDVTGELIKLDPFVNLTWKHQNYISDPVSTQMIGKYNFYNFLSAISFGVLFDVEPELINAAIASYVPDNNRSQIKKTARNTLILDCYNANPTSLSSALESFAMNDSDLDKFVIIGAMKELGDHAEEEHQKIVDKAAELGLHGYFVGNEFKGMNSESVDQHFDSVKDLQNFLANQEITGKIILLKGSRSIGLEDLEELL